MQMKRKPKLPEVEVVKDVFEEEVVENKEVIKVPQVIEEMDKKKEFLEIINKKVTKELPEVEVG